MCPGNVLEILQKTPLFSSLSLSMLEILVNNSVVLDVARGRVVFQEGSEPKGLYVLLNGQIKLYKVSETGREQILDIVDYGTPVFEASVFHTGVLPVSAMAIQNSRLWYVEKEAMMNLIMRDTRFALNLLDSLSRGIVQMTVSIGQLSLFSVLSRVSLYLLHLAEENKADVFDLGITKCNISGLLGISREALSRALSKLVSQNVIIMKHRKITVVDFERLVTFAGGTN